MLDLVVEWPAAVCLTFQQPLRNWQCTPAPLFFEGNATVAFTLRRWMDTVAREGHLPQNDILPSAVSGSREAKSPPSYQEIDLLSAEL